MDLSRRQLFTTLGAGAVAASVPVRTAARTGTSARVGDPADFAAVSCARPSNARLSDRTTFSGPIVYSRDCRPELSPPAFE